jgi:hypothetical protein
MAITFNVDLLLAAHGAAIAAIDAAGGNAYVTVEDADNLVLSTLPLMRPCGTLNATTGRLTFAIGPRDEEAAASGDAHHGKLCDSNGKVWLSGPCAAGATPLDGYFMLRSLAVVQGTPFELLSMTLG